MKTRISELALAALVLTACGQAGPDANAVNTAIVETQAAQQPSSTPQNVAPSTNTPRPSPTPLPPTGTPVPTEHFSTDDLWAKNYVGSMESGGVVVEIARVLVGYKSAMPDWGFEDFNDYIQGWANVDVVGELVFKITNNTNVTMSIFPDQGTVQIGSEQIDLSDYMFGTTFGDAIGGEIYPGVTKIGGMWFGIRRSTPSEVTQLIYRCSAPRKSDDFRDQVGPAIVLTIDVPVHAWEDMPAELR